MIQTYRALLQGNRLEWLEEIPVLMASETSIPVQVTIDTQDKTKDKTKDKMASEKDRQKKVLLILEQIAQTGAFNEIQDASAWQRQMRIDRALPNRE